MLLARGVRPIRLSVDDTTRQLHHRRAKMILRWAVNLRAVIAAERQRYVDFYIEAKCRFATTERDVVGELLVSVNNEAIPYPHRYIRVDIMYRHGEDETARLCQVVLEPNENFQPTGFKFGEFQVDIYPFSWESIQVAFDKAPKDVKQIESWITYWLDVEDKRIDSQADLSGAIHSFTRIETNGEWWFLTGDFGTAPVDALIELIELLASQGMSIVILKAG